MLRLTLSYLIVSGQAKAPTEQISKFKQQIHNMVVTDFLQSAKHFHGERKVFQNGAKATEKYSFSNIRKNK